MAGRTKQIDSDFFRFLIIRSHRFLVKVYVFGKPFIICGVLSINYFKGKLRSYLSSIYGSIPKYISLYPSHKFISE